MTKRVPFSNENLTFGEVLSHHIIVQKSVYSFYRTPLQPEFIGYTLKELESELENRLEEHDKNSCLTLLSAMEALIRMDYLQRCYTRQKDNISRKFRELHKDSGARASLEDDILAVWKEEGIGKNAFSQAIGAFKYRHWLAHGRYWIPKLGRDFDFDYIYALACEIEKLIAD
jgi:hypothetical protein